MEAGMVQGILFEVVVYSLLMKSKVSDYRLRNPLFRMPIQFTELTVQFARPFLILLFCLRQ